MFHVDVFIIDFKKTLSQCSDTEYENKYINMNMFTVKKAKSYQPFHELFFGK